MGLDQYMIIAGRNASTGRYENIEDKQYFRKFNALHNWVVENCYNTGDDPAEDNCVVFKLTKGDLQDLKETCVKTLAIYTAYVEKVKKKGKLDEEGDGDEDFPISDPKWTEAQVLELDGLLPTCSGFFFGSTDYDRWYFQNVKLLLECVEGMLEIPIEEVAQSFLEDDALSEDEIEQLQMAQRKIEQMIKERSDYIEQEAERLAAAYLKKHPTNEETGEPRTLQQCMWVDEVSRELPVIRARWNEKNGNPYDMDPFIMTGIHKDRQYTDIIYGYYAWY